MIESVNQPFNPASFNFLKIKQPEILLELVKENNLAENSLVEGNQQNGTDKQTTKVSNLTFSYNRCILKKCYFNKKR